MREVLTKNLQAAPRQELAICCALIGRSRVIILDVPNARLDEVAPMRNWELITKEILGPIILITESNPAVVEALGDRVAFFGIVFYSHNAQGSEFGYVSTTKEPGSVYLLILPHFAMCNPISTVYYSSERKRVCEHSEIFCATVQHKVRHNNDKSRFSQREGVMELYKIQHMRNS
uniref:ABC transporter domain-containing protein n=1 Tax=Glossina austeni TaxID=7395 RepID=A0A1A9VY73_GLOAU